MISIALLEPKIPQNTGNIARLAVGLNIKLILIGKLGFSINDKHLKRAGLDYWKYLKLEVYDDFKSFLNYYKDNRIIIATTKGKTPYYDFIFKKGDILLFGSETKGVPVNFIRENVEMSVTIPMIGEVRSINLSNSAAVLAYHSLYEVGYFKSFSVNSNYNDLNL